MEIRRAESADWDGIWAIFREVVAAGTTYAYAPETTREEGFAIWMTPPVVPYVAVDGTQIVGAYLIKPNQPGLGSHVANAGFVVPPEREGQGIGRAMGRHALDEARKAGFHAMQFNIVVSTNTRAVALWKSLGFEIVGTVPQAFRHRALGLVDIYVMHRLL